MLDRETLLLRRQNLTRESQQLQNAVVVAEERAKQAALMYAAKQGALTAINELLADAEAPIEEAKS